MAEYVKEKRLPSILASGKPYNILELGSGCGFSSIFLKKHCDANVNFIVTDVPNVCNLIQENIDSNFENESIAAKPLFWGNKSDLDNILKGLGP
jgi:methylase of polypeptide subunit release factors